MQQTSLLAGPVCGVGGPVTLHQQRYLGYETIGTRFEPVCGAGGSLGFYEPVWKRGSGF